MTGVTHASHGLVIGHVWAFLRDARDQALIQPGAIVAAGDEDAPAVAEVVDIVDKPADRVVHLRILPGLIEDYQAVIQRAVCRPDRTPRSAPRSSARAALRPTENTISQIPPNTAKAPNPQRRMRAFLGASDLDLH